MAIPDSRVAIPDSRVKARLDDRVQRVRVPRTPQPTTETVITKSIAAGDFAGTTLFVRVHGERTRVFEVGALRRALDDPAKSNNGRRGRRPTKKFTNRKK